MDAMSVLAEIERLADYLDPVPSVWVKESCKSVPATFYMNYVTFVYKYMLPPSVNAKMNPNISHMIQVEFERMINQEVSSSPEPRKPDYSPHDVLPPYMKALLNKLQDHVTRTYLQTASLANPSYAFHDEGHSERIIDYLNQLTSLHQLTHRLSADALDIDHRRTIRNPVLFKKLRSDNPASYAYHLCHQRIQSVRVNPQSRQIDVQALVRTKTDKDRIKRFINERLKLRREVKTLVPHLWSCIPDLKDELNLDIQCTTLAPALPASIVTEEFLNGKASVQAVDVVSGESASEGKSSTSAHQFDTCAYYETGLHQLRNRVKQDHPRYSEFLVYQQRLTENIGHSRRYGDTEARKAERSEMIDHLNELSLSVLGMPFTDLCGSSTPTTGQEPSERLRGN